MGTRVRDMFPGIVAVARADREFLARVARFLVDAGVHQFLNIGTGLPTANNTHSVAQERVPESRVVYVDNDPLVLVHARALLTGGPRGAGRLRRGRHSGPGPNSARRRGYARLP